jgi:hypothetical protein
MWLVAVLAAVALALAILSSALLRRRATIESPAE